MRLNLLIRWLSKYLTYIAEGDFVCYMFCSVGSHLRDLSRKDFGGFCDEINEVSSVSWE